MTYKKTKDDEDILQEARRRFKICTDAEADNRDLALDDINFRNNDQWDELTKRERKNRPCLTINKLEQRIDQVTGDQRMNRMGPVIRPLNVVNANLKQKFTQAEVLTGIIRNIEAVSNAKTAYTTAFDHAVGHGFGYWRIITEYNDDDSFDQDIKIKRIANAFRVYLDPSAEEMTKMDAMYGFISQYVDKEEYPNGDWERGKGEERELWFDNDQVRIAEYFRRVEMDAILWSINGVPTKVKDDFMDIRDELTEQGVIPDKERTVKTYKVEWYKLSCNEIFEKQVFPSKYIPIVPCYGKELNVKGKTFYRGVIRYAKDPQRIYNYTRSASVEQVALAPKAPWVVEERQLGDHKKMWEQANNKNYSVLPYKNVPGVPPPQRQMPPQPSSGWITESGIADQDIDSASGLYKASLGAPSNERSGKAINARKMEGDVGTFHFHDNRALSLQHTYEILVDMIPRVYDTERLVRIKTPEDQEEIITINQKVFDDESSQWVKVYDLSLGKYEVAVDVGASYTTQRQQASESMMELIQYAPDLAPRILDLIAKNLDWPGADDIANRLTPPDPSTLPPDPQVVKLQMEDKWKTQDLQLKAQNMEIDARYKADQMEIEKRELQIKEQELIIKEKELMLKEKEVDMDALLKQEDNDTKLAITQMQQEMKNIENDIQERRDIQERLRQEQEEKKEQMNKVVTLTKDDGKTYKLEVKNEN